jgi:hypothetical protein
MARIMRSAAERLTLLQKAVVREEQVMKEKIFEPSSVDRTTAGGVGADGRLDNFLEKCGKFAAYTTPKMKELLCLGDGKFRSTGS